ncbi:hypothetical protein NC661_06155 [Aquibacillus koreensis]|uniref:Alpha/beta hydrolase n=1 Tax=Aquibacillus koreensis TaxID=279446 RepID=A0A9X4AHG7_9BACI|nr:hypothetical protein [Aquibacillus koreensis]MCT2537066.1 hypothetical protein [Aquibacillus koreensis]MDC3419951.1 hypothetical protein [Aquibacillus koreensis]
MKLYLIKFGHWFIQRLSRIPEKDRTYARWCIFVLWFATTVASMMEAIGNPTGASTFTQLTDIGKAVGLNGLYFLGATIIIGILLAFLYVPLPRLLLGSFAYTIYSSVRILIDDKSGKVFSYIAGIGYSLVCLLIGLFLFLLFYKKTRKIIAFSIFPIIFVIAIFLDFYDKEINSVRGYTQSVFANKAEEMTVENPAQKGDYDYRFLTYGSGKDKHREAFGSAVDIVTPSVDATRLDTVWSDKREAFWGFDLPALPVNGRTWMPEGEGPFPLILMVHGNHAMEDFSVNGYDYLGELLASRGFLTVSVDQDFINSSKTYGSPKNDYKLRAWMILQHLIQLQEMNETPGHILSQKIDFDQVGLVGHSRGGQAVQVVADYPLFFKDRSLRKQLENININAVVSLAPTDEKVDGKRPYLRNVSYLLLQGARDADVNDYRGDEQFYRTTYDKNDDGFKASVYIADANHSQFNSEWGRMDSDLPKGIFLNQMQTMAPEEQRQVAKVYLSAFFEHVFHQQTSYEQLFRDHQYGKEWLPATTIVSKYRNASYVPITQITHSRGDTLSTNGVSVQAEGFSKWGVITPKQRKGNDRPIDAVLLEWEGDATYTITMPKDLVKLIGLEQPENLVLTLANIGVDGDDIPAVEIELESEAGMVESRSLEDVMSIPPVIETVYTHFGLFDDVFRDGKYEKGWEPVFQTFTVPIESFEITNLVLENGGYIKKIRLRLEANSGRVLLEEVGAE